MSGPAFWPSHFGWMTASELVRYAANTDCDPLTRELAIRLDQALERLQSKPQASRVGRPKGKPKWTVDETTWLRSRRKSHRQVALSLLPTSGDKLSNYELTRRLAVEAGTTTNTAGNVIRKLVADGLFTSEGRGKRRLITRAVI